MATLDNINSCAGKTDLENKLIDFNAQLNGYCRHFYHVSYLLFYCVTCFFFCLIFFYFMRSLISMKINFFNESCY